MLFILHFLLRGILDKKRIDEFTCYPHLMVSTHVFPAPWALKTPRVSPCLVCKPGLHALRGAMPERPERKTQEAKALPGPQFPLLEKDGGGLGNLPGPHNWSSVSWKSQSWKSPFCYSSPMDTFQRGEESSKNLNIACPRESATIYCVYHEYEMQIMLVYQRWLFKPISMSEKPYFKFYLILFLYDPKMHIQNQQKDVKWWDRWTWFQALV